jgi:hypothetical protein
VEAEARDRRKEVLHQIEADPIVGGGDRHPAIGADHVEIAEGSLGPALRDQDGTGRRREVHRGGATAVESLAAERDHGPFYLEPKPKSLKTVT